MYNLNQLSTFVKVAELGSFNKVAEEEFISPNAVMQQINNLESELEGVKLFVRSKRGNKLTPAGELLYREAKRILSNCETSKRMVIDTWKAERLPVRIAVTYGSSLSVFGDLWKEIHKRYPEIVINIVPMVYNEKTDRNLWSNFNEYTDVFLCYIDEEQTPENYIDYLGMEFGGIEITSFPLYCMVNSNHRLAEKEEITLEDLRGESVSILSEGWGKNAGTLRKHIEDNYPDITLSVNAYYGSEEYNKCANTDMVIVGAFDSATVHPFIKAIPFSKKERSFSNHIGFVYVNPPSEPISRFIDAIMEIKKDIPDIVI